MDFRLVRDVFLPKATLSTLTVDGKRFGFVCEDLDRGLDASMSDEEIARIKVPRETAIPTGRYRVLLTHSPKYGRDVLQLVDVRGYRGLRIHSGNDNDDTEGCLLPGLARDVGRGVVIRSAVAVRWLEQEYARRTAKGEETWIEVVRDPVAWEARPR